ncbi:MAG: NAD(P)-binding protein [Gammaproteobacteria bacterium]|nr:NAD(P)-binding protein [Gammaproteobacteria bacterium]
MDPSDKILGMDKLISRRDILHGFGGIAAGAITSSVIPTTAIAGQLLSPEKAAENITNNDYPPALTGLRGDHQGSFEVAHKLGREAKKDWGPVLQSDKTIYDLVVVGAGISGLSAAHFYQKQYPDARILILDNHDDFGGHAKRNEFQVGDKKLIAYGGAQTMQEPSDYSDIVKDLLADIGVDIKRFNKAYDQSFYKRHGLGGGIQFNHKNWGKDKIVHYDLGNLGSYLPLRPSKLSAVQAVDAMPISIEAKLEFSRLLTTTEDQIPEISKKNKKKYLYSLSYRDFLTRHLDIHQAEVFAVLQDLASDFGAGIDAVPAYSALDYAGLPGWDAAGLPDTDEDEEAYIHHFPDGNASIARLLVRKMIPAVSTGNNMEDVIQSKFNYSALDQADSTVRLRLNSTVVKVKHNGNPESATQLTVSYINKGQAYSIQARASVLACNNSMIPFICPELPKLQSDALALQVKTPILYTNVALSNWRAWKKLGLGAVVSPGEYHINAMLDFPVSMGGYQYSGSPDEPIIVHMERFPHKNNEGLNSHEQKRIGRHELLVTSFETIERNVRKQLTNLLGTGGFDPAKDIKGITVNRWAHGYASWYNSLFETTYDDWNDERYPHMQARKPFGLIRIANSDAAATAMMEAAIEQGYRAISELIS